MIRRPPRSPLFPNTTPFRSCGDGRELVARSAKAVDHRGERLHEPLRCARGSLGVVRSEEHTSELQSQSNLVCRLLLEKKKPMSPPSPRGSAPPSRIRSATLR